MYKIVKAECLADKIYLMDVEAPRVAKACQPGEFVIVKMDEIGERIPLTICDYDREKGLVTIVFQTVGASTERMAGMKAGDYFQDFVGPLGQPSEFVKDDLEEVKKRFMQTEEDLFSFVAAYPFAQEVSFDERITFYCQIVSQFYEELRITGDYGRMGGVEYALIYSERTGEIV